MFYGIFSHGAAHVLGLLWHTAITERVVVYCWKINNLHFISYYLKGEKFHFIPFKGI